MNIKNIRSKLLRLLRGDEGQTAAGAILLVAGAITIFIGIMVVGEMYGAVIGTSYTNESLGSFGGNNITSLSVANPRMSNLETIVVRNISTTMTLNTSFDSWGCSNVPCYNIIDYDTGAINVTLGYAQTVNVSGQDGSTDTIYIDYTQSSLKEAVIRTTLLAAMGFTMTGFLLLGISLIVLGAAIILGYVQILSGGGIRFGRR